jgi:hypothetical protein
MVTLVLVAKKRGLYRYLLSEVLDYLTTQILKPTPERERVTITLVLLVKVSKFQKAGIKLTLFIQYGTASFLFFYSIFYWVIFKS